MKTSKFIQEVAAFAEQMSERLPQTKEGGIIIMATDGKHVAKCFIARPSDKKDILRSFLSDADIRQSIIEIINDRN